MNVCEASCQLGKSMIFGEHLGRFYAPLAANFLNGAIPRKFLEIPGFVTGGRSRLAACVARIGKSGFIEGGIEAHLWPSGCGNRRTREEAKQAKSVEITLRRWLQFFGVDY